MPYIRPENRKEINEFVDKLLVFTGTPGKMNYAITRLLHQFIRRNGVTYNLLNSAVGVLECVKQELYRQIVAVYEDDKKLDNGPVSMLDEEY